MEVVVELLPGLITGGGIVAIGGLILKFFQEKRAGTSTAVEEWRDMNEERKQEIREMKEELEKLRSLMVSCMMEIQRLDPESPILAAGRAVLQPEQKQ